MQRSIIPLLLIATMTAVSSRSACAQVEMELRGERGRYTVTAADDRFVLVEQNTGRTWLLVHSEEEHGGPVWLPIERIDDPEEAAHWRHEQHAAASEREQHEREMAELHRHDEQARVEQMKIRAHLEEVSRQHDELRERFGADDPKVRDLAKHREQIARELDELALHRREREDSENLRNLKDQHRHQDEIRSRIGELTERLRDLREQLGREHPEVRALQAEIERLERELAQEDTHHRELEVIKHREHSGDAARRGPTDAVPKLQETARKARLQALKHHLQHLREHLGEDHPAARSIEEQIEKLGNPDAAPDQREEVDEASAAQHSRLLPGERELLLTHDVEHPELTVLRNQIETIRNSRGDENR